MNNLAKRLSNGLLCKNDMIIITYCFLYNLQSECEFEKSVNEINAGRPQCPVGLNTLVLPSKGTLGMADKQPYIYLHCGHVHGQHTWGQRSDDLRTCPLCLTVSNGRLTVTFIRSCLRHEITA